MRWCRSIGSGTYADPKRPLFAPVPGAMAQRADAIHAYQWEPSDDGQYAIVEFIARDRAAFAALTGDARAARVFVKGRTRGADIEKQLRTFKKDFSLERFGRRPR